MHHPLPLLSLFLSRARAVRPLGSPALCVSPYAEGARGVMRWDRLFGWVCSLSSFAVGAAAARAARRLVSARPEATDARSLAVGGATDSAKDAQRV